MIQPSLASFHFVTTTKRAPLSEYRLALISLDEKNYSIMGNALEQIPQCLKSNQMLATEAAHGPVGIKHKDAVIDVAEGVGMLEQDNSFREHGFSKIRRWITSTVQTNTPNLIDISGRNIDSGNRRTVRLASGLSSAVPILKGLGDKRKRRAADAADAERGVKTGAKQRKLGITRG
jgi:hypothetical protein